MKNRTEAKYIIKLYESQWDNKHDESVKPFFEQLKRELDRVESGHDALFSYHVFATDVGLDTILNYKQDAGVNGRLKIAYFAVHGQQDKLQAMNNINRSKLRSILINTTNYDGFFFWNV